MTKQRQIECFLQELELVYHSGRRTGLRFWVIPFDNQRVFVILMDGGAHVEIRTGPLASLSEMTYHHRQRLISQLLSENARTRIGCYMVDIDGDHVAYRTAFWPHGEPLTLTQFGCAIGAAVVAINGFKAILGKAGINGEAQDSAVRFPNLLERLSRDQAN